MCSEVEGINMENDVLTVMSNRLSVMDGYDEERSKEFLDSAKALETLNDMRLAEAKIDSEIESKDRELDLRERELDIRERELESRESISDEEGKRDKRNFWLNVAGHVIKVGSIAAGVFLYYKMTKLGIDASDADILFDRNTTHTIADGMRFATEAMKAR